MRHLITRSLDETQCPRCTLEACVEPERGEGRGQQVACNACGLREEFHHFADEFDLDQPERKQRSLVGKEVAHV